MLRYLFAYTRRELLERGCFVFGYSKEMQQSSLVPGVSIGQRIQELSPWFHNMMVGGVRTAPDHFLGNYPEVKYRHYRDLLPADMAGMTVLDIGCNAGFYSMEMKRRGASRVLGIDTDEHYLRQARFAAEVEGLEITYERMTVWEIGGLREKFDLVIFMGVLCHLRHPLLALDLIHEHVAKDRLLFQSMLRGGMAVGSVAEDYPITAPVDFEAAVFPKMHFIERRYADDPTNWWIPNRAGVEAMLRSSGFRIEAQPEDETYLCRWEALGEPVDGPHCVYPHPGS